MILLEQILLAIAFLLTFFITIVLPGFFLLNKIKANLDDLEKITLSAVLGFALFTIFAYVLSWLHLRFLMYLFPVLGILFLFKFRRDLLNLKFNISFKTFFWTVLVIGMIGQVAVNVPSGFPYKQSLPADAGKEGIYFWSSHGHDGVWHLSLMEQMKKWEFPFQNPELAGAKLQNYHFFVDLLMSEFSRLFKFSNLDIYFRFMPIVFSVLLGLSSFIFVRAWSKKEIAGIWAMIFTYFCGSFGYLLYIPTHNSLGGESIFWLSQTQSVLGNPPHAAAFIIVTIFLFTFFKYLTNRNPIFFLLSALFGGVVIEFKVYGGVLILGGLLFVGAYELIFKRIHQTLLLFLCTLVIALVIYLPNSANSQDFLIWQPWWFIRTMVVAPDRLNWLDLELRRQTYIAESNWKRVIQLETTAFLIFLLGNLGMRFFGFFEIFKQIKQKRIFESFNLFFLIVTVTSFLIPVFFLQKGVAWNAIQFNQYFLLLFGFLAAISTVDLLDLFKRKTLKIILVIAIILLAIPTQLGLLWQFYSNLPLSKVSNNELEALEFLKKLPEGIVLVAPFNRYESAKYKIPPIPIYAWYDTGYVSAFSGKKTLISDEEQVNIMGYDVTNLVKDRAEAFESKDFTGVNNFLEKYNIDYIYLVWDQKFATDSALLNIDQIFQNQDAEIFKVRK